MEVDQEVECYGTYAVWGGVFILILGELASEPKIDVYQRVHSLVNGPH